MIVDFIFCCRPQHRNQIRHITVELVCNGIWLPPVLLSGMADLNLTKAITIDLLSASPLIIGLPMETVGN